jgi:hypothetical protein
MADPEGADAREGEGAQEAAEHVEQDSLSAWATLVALPGHRDHVASRQSGGVEQAVRCGHLAALAPAPDQPGHLTTGDRPDADQGEAGERQGPAVGQPQAVWRAAAEAPHR